MAQKLSDKYKQAFFSGLAALLPTILTIFVLSFCWQFLTEKIATPITDVIKTALSTELAKDYYWKGLLNKQDFQLNEDNNDPQADTLAEPDIPFSELVQGYVPDWVGIIIAVALVLIVGLLFRGYLGRQIWRSAERVVQRIPVLKVIYPYAKQVTEFFFAEKKQITYDSVVAVEYPRKGIYSIGFVTSEGFRSVSETAGKEVVAIFIPSSPTPVTGYTILVPKEDTIALDVSVDEALRFTISGGVILPPSQTPTVSLKTRRLERPVKPEQVES